MQVLNIRRGHATNSSSSHSLIFLDEAKYVPPVGKGKYGWENFVLVTPEHREKYFAQMLYNSLRECLGATWEDTIPDELLSALYHAYDVALPNNVRDGYVDHDSCWSFPRQYNSRYLSKEFVVEAHKFLVQKGLVILGGNDNSDGHPLKSRAAFNLPLSDFYAGEMICRHDAKGDYWAIYNPRTGTKIRMRFGPDQTIPDIAVAPELVDLKVTDFCEKACAYCYQDCSTTGEHADFYEVTTILKALGDMQVFEVALGGGEPTKHPRFWDMLEWARRYGITPNFTTKDLSWLEDTASVEKVKRYCGAFSYTVSDAKDIDSFARLTKEAGFDVQQLAVNVVMGTQADYSFPRTLAAAANHGIRVVLLGYKPMGRGSKYKPIPYPWWLASIKKLRDVYCCPAISVDTALAAEYTSELDKYAIPRYFYETKDGTYSAYIDAVKKTMALSSWADPAKAVSFTIPKEDSALTASLRNIWDSLER